IRECRRVREPERTSQERGPAVRIVADVRCGGIVGSDERKPIRRGITLMTTHLTVRLAWHDNGWDGTICQKPEANCYCCGSHSLLPDGIARDKQPSVEEQHRGQPLDVLLPGYLPPCYWSSCAFSPRPTNVVHSHPFRNYRETHVIPDQLPPASAL